MRINPAFWMASPLIVLCGFSMAALETPSHEKKGAVTVVYNHEGSSSEPELVQRGGFAAYVHLEEHSVLLDVGGEASIILENLQRLDTDFSRIEAVVISHNHWDHVFGLPGVMSGSRTKAPVYVAESAAAGVHQQFPRATVVPVGTTTEVAPRVWVTKPLEIEFMGAHLSEQALVIERSDGLHVLVGCSHPGIVDIVKLVKEEFPGKPIAFVGGGFHLRSTPEPEIREIAAELDELGVRKIGPAHCSGDAAKRIIRELWGDRFVSFDLGDTVRF